MAKDETQTQPTVSVTATDLGALIRAVESNAPTKKVPYSKHEPRTTFAQGKTRKQRAKLERNLYINGYRVNPRLMFDSEILLTNMIVSGRFMDGLVIVRTVESSSPEDPDAVYVSFPNKTIDQRFEMARQTGNSMTNLLRRCCDEAGLETKDIPNVAPPKRARVVS